MDWVTDTVSAFGHSVGIEGLALDQEGRIAFSLESGDMLCIHDLQPSGGNEVLVVLARALEPPPAATARRALRMADFRASPLWEIQLGIRDDKLLATLRIPRHSFIQSALEDAIEALVTFHARAGEAH